MKQAQALFFGSRIAATQSEKNVIRLFFMKYFQNLEFFGLQSIGYRLKAPVDAISKVSGLCISKPCSSRFKILTEFEIFYFKISMIRTPMPKVKSKEIKSKIRDPPTIYFIGYKLQPQVLPKRIPENGGLYVAVR